MVITRLPVGHTHEDIDSKFAFIWKRVRNCFVLTPLAYKCAIEESLSTTKYKCEVVDIFAVPNYEKYIRPYIVPDFGRYAKIGRNGNDWTQLQFIFEHVPASEFFPCGVKTTYRKFSADEVVLIQEISAGKPEDGFVVREVEVRTCPPSRDGHPEGLSMLTALPPADRLIEPDAFVLGSRALLDSCVAKIKTHLRNQPAIVSEWEQFAAAAPSGDCVQTFCASHPLDIPLKVNTLHFLVCLFV